MPTYGYRCPQCSTDFDLWQRMTDEAGADCPVCGTPSIRQFFPAGIVFKGSGFYKTDSRSTEGGGQSKGPEAAAEPSSKDAGEKPVSAPASDASPAAGTTPATPPAKSSKPSGGSGSSPAEPSAPKSSG
jgi:putative FmdB family regulatory protein